MGFQQGLSGLNSSSKSLDTIGNNIANSGTVGFKNSSAQFADVYAASLNGSGASPVGIGAKVAGIVQQFSQGNISVTNNPLDTAINGGGFFQMDDGSGGTVYGRNGQFQLDKDGYIVNAQGLQLKGITAVNGAIATGSPAIALRLFDPTQSLSGTPLMTGGSSSATGIQANVNLDSRLSPPATPVFDYNNPTSYNQSTATTIYDSLGNPHTYSMYFVKTAAPAVNTWNVYATLTNPNGALIDLTAPSAASAASVTAATAENLLAAAAVTAATAAAVGGATPASVLAAVPTLPAAVKTAAATAATDAALAVTAATTEEGLATAAVTAAPLAAAALGATSVDVKTDLAVAALLADVTFTASAAGTLLNNAFTVAAAAETAAATGTDAATAAAAVAGVAGVPASVLAAANSAADLVLHPAADQFSVTAAVETAAAAYVSAQVAVAAPGAVLAGVAAATGVPATVLAAANTAATAVGATAASVLAAVQAAAPDAVLAAVAAAAALDVAAAVAAGPAAVAAAAAAAAAAAGATPASVLTAIKVAALTTVGSMVFDTSGTLTSTKFTASVTDVQLGYPGGVGTIDPTTGAVSPTQTFAVDFSGSTQYGAAFAVNALLQDGYASGTLAGFNIGKDGIVLGRYTNGQTKAVGQVVLASFRNPQGLQPLGDNRWAQSPTSGDPITAAPGSSGQFGALQSSAVEDSNVDLTAELVNMITQQRAYQANAQTIKTVDSILQTLVNLR
jgi:flagellar hook protein FlgE